MKLQFSITLLFIAIINLASKAQGSRTYASESVLSSGNWYKIRISKDGIYKLTASDIKAMKLLSTAPKTEHIRVYGNGGNMLPEISSIERADDLSENPIQIFDLNSDGYFNNEDYLLFYGSGPHTWHYNENLKRYTHQKHLYDDFSYYFITIKKGFGKRIQTNTTNYPAPNVLVKHFTDYHFHEKDSLNLVKSGREWYGELFDIIDSYSFKFSYPNIVKGSPVKIRTNIIARSTISSSLVFKANQFSKNIHFSSVSTGYLGIFAHTTLDTFSYNASSTSIDIKLTYNKPNSNSQAWLNYIEVNAKRQLSMYGTQMKFTSPEAVGAGNIAEYNLQNANNKIQIWDISNPLNPLKIQCALSGNTLKFKSSADSLKSFIAHYSSYPSPTLMGKIENQNLHALSNIDYIILYHPLFKSQAEELATFHRNYSNLRVFTTSLLPIYNEFSSGTKDITAIRDFIKMLYDKGNQESKKPPKYLLLFGDASYDYKNRIANNTNMVPTYESPNSLSRGGESYCTDDFFGALDDDEGDGDNDDLDIAIGRFPVSTTEEANAIIEKIKRYANQSENNAENTNLCSNQNNNTSSMGEWRNMACFIGDDEDGERHMRQANNLGDYVRTNHPEYNVDKILFDAYTQITTPGGQRYPEAKRALNHRVEKGALVISYTGHGGEEGWAHESVLEIKDINSWTNLNRLPLFITATCEFSRYDDPERTSAGEMVLLHPSGGGIALLTTSRVTNSSNNNTLSNYICKHIFEEQYSLGGILQTAKNQAGSIHHNKNFVLLGDPALKLAYPKDQVVTTSITNHNDDLVVDTIRALQTIKIEGEVRHNNQLASDFNGTIYPTIFDKAQQYISLGNDEGSAPFQFELQKSIIYKGKTLVKNGKFEFSFVVPKDIAYKFGKGKISYYASNNQIDANGYTDTIMIGGTYELAEEDNKGPEIDLYINDSLFVFGGITAPNPQLLAYVFDENGINTIGNGIGHDIKAILDENSTQPIILNEFYEANWGDYQRGVIRYPFFELEEGLHTLSLKVWDVYNNSAEAYTEFIVASDQKVVMENLLSAPNPFYNETSFIFEHNQSCDQLNIQVLIFNTSGQLVRELNATVNSTGYRVGIGQLTWDGTGDHGQKLAKGVYIYKLRIKNSDGHYEEQSSKVVLMR